MAAFSTSLDLNSRVKYSSAELMIIRDRLVITISPKLKSALGRHDNGVAQQSTGSNRQEETMCPKTEERKAGGHAGPAKG